jgi:hypothetical protein
VRIPAALSELSSNSRVASWQNERDTQLLATHPAARSHPNQRPKEFALCRQTDHNWQKQAQLLMMLPSGSAGDKRAGDRTAGW